MWAGLVNIPCQMWLTSVRMLPSKRSRQKCRKRVRICRSRSSGSREETDRRWQLKVYALQTSSGKSCSGPTRAATVAAPPAPKRWHPLLPQPSPALMLAARCTQMQAQVRMWEQCAQDSPEPGVLCMRSSCPCWTARGKGRVCQGSPAGRQQSDACCTTLKAAWVKGSGPPGSCAAA